MPMKYQIDFKNKLNELLLYWIMNKLLPIVFDFLAKDTRAVAKNH